MKILFLTVLITFILWGNAFPQSDDLEKDQPLRNAAQTILKQLINDITTLPEGSRYFSRTSSPEIQFSQTPAVHIPPEEGWIYLFNYNNGVTYVPDDKAPTARKSPFTAVFADDDSIELEIFVSYKRGGTLVSRTKTYELSKEPELKIGYDLKTKNEDPKLKNAISARIESDLPGFRKLLSSVENK